MSVLVTGAAGFIGSHLSRRLLDLGFDVVGADRMTDYYPISLKRENLDLNLRNHRFRFHEVDLATCDLLPMLNDVQVVYHLAAQAGVRSSWGKSFNGYVSDNIIATQRLLEAACSAGVQKFVYASSSSVYGNSRGYPTDEDSPKLPQSPYGVTKLAAENLVSLYSANFGLASTCLRYHTVYGPHQRPDMAINRLIRCALTGMPFQLFGAGSYIRDFTYVSDIVSATIQAGGTNIADGMILNIAGGDAVSMMQLLRLIERLTGKTIPFEESRSTPGDVKRTGGSVVRAREALGWSPVVGLDVGLRSQIDQIRSDLELYKMVLD